VLAVTDHDTVAGVAEARAAGRRLGVEVLTGCELTASVGNRVVHVLLYGQGLLKPDLAKAVEGSRRGRDERNRAVGERLERLCGVGDDDAVRVAGASALSRAHFARALVARGTVADVGEAFDRLLSSGRPAYVPAPGVSMTDAVAMAGKAGGVAVLAHPGRLATAERDRVLHEALPGSTASRSGTPSTTPTSASPWSAWPTATACWPPADPTTTATTSPTSTSAPAPTPTSPSPPTASTPSGPDWRQRARMRRFRAAYLQGRASNVLSIRWPMWPSTASAGMRRMRHPRLAVFL
jgi:predicted metal-dependent phosphoesterase TrpH